MQFGNRIVALYSKNKAKRYFFTSELFQDDLIELETALEDIHVSFFGFFILNTAYLFDNFLIFESVSLICMYESLYFLCTDYNLSLTLINNSIYRYYYINLYLKSFIAFYILNLISNRKLI